MLVHTVTPTAQSWTSSSAAGTWSTPGSWSGATVPTTTTNASVIDTGANPQTVTVAASTTVQQITVQGNTSSMTLEVLQGVRLGVSYELIVGTHGTLRGGGSILGDVVVNGGTVAQGILSPATLAVTGDFTAQNQSTIQLALAGDTPSLCDSLAVDGTFTMGGQLDVVDINGFSPSLGDTFDLLDFASATGQFGQVDLPPSRRVWRGIFQLCTAMARSAWSASRNPLASPGWACPRCWC